jgi:hypothetical protein
MKTEIQERKTEIRALYSISVISHFFFFKFFCGKIAHKKFKIQCLEPKILTNSNTFSLEN